MTSVLLLPLHGAFLVITLVIFVVKLVALIDACRHPDAAYQAAGKLSKTAWIAILAVALLFSWVGFFSIAGLVAAIVYLVDVRPAVRQMKGGRGPYGGW